MVVRHDWNKYFEDFLESPSDSVRGFFEGYDKDVPVKTLEKRTQGWVKRKREHKNNKAVVAVVETTMQPVVVKSTQEVLKVNEEMVAAKNAIVALITNSFTSKDAKPFDRKDVHAAKIAWEILKVELEEPTSITRGKNENLNVNANMDINWQETKTYEAVHQTDAST